MNKVGKKTPVWQNAKTGEVKCGATVQAALGVSWLFPVSSDWVQVKEVPKAKRVVIDSDGFVLPENDITIAIATDAVRAGELTIKAYRREYKFNVAYCDRTRVILQEG